ncbi:response regulator [Streptomyces himalayensis]|uniref:response regulator n=1 Tax=Streptomyces himalayensis TaxID=2820085 RepID=UPI001C69B54C|nr:response regulator [Streptomyces himalayensis]
MAGEARILMVDDHEGNLFALESALTPLGLPLERATGGDEALKIILRGGIGLVLLDVVMPDVSGLDVVRYMSRLEQTQGIPVILLTGLGHDSQISTAALQLGVADFVVKPVDPWALRMKARYLYATHQRMRSLEQELVALRGRSGKGTGAEGAAVSGPGPRPGTGFGAGTGCGSGTGTEPGSQTGCGTVAEAEARAPTAKPRPAAAVRPRGVG